MAQNKKERVLLQMTPNNSKVYLDLKIKKLRASAVEYYRQGKLQQAVAQQIALINESKLVGKDNVGDLAMLGGFFMTMGEHQAALKIWQDCLQLKPDDSLLLENYAIALKNVGEIDQSNAILLRLVAINPQNANAYDTLADNCALQQNWAEARHYGLKSLQIKDELVTAQALAPIELPLPRRRFNFGQRSAENVIAFSLWGQSPRYLKSAVENVHQAAELYPEWVCRFYCDQSVPQDVCAQLVEAGAELIFKPDNQLFEGLFWRFEVAYDPKVAFFLVRDADAVVNQREQAAVHEWLRSEAHFHVMRDYHTHSELILAGLWGGVGQVLPNMHGHFFRQHSGRLPMRGIDQLFLREQIWPLIKSSVITHDSIFGFLGQPFPPHSELPPHQHVGQAKYMPVS